MSPNFDAISNSDLRGLNVLQVQNMSNPTKLQHQDVALKLCKVTDDPGEKAIKVKNIVTYQLHNLNETIYESKISNAFIS